MTKVLLSPLIAQWMDNLGDVLNGGKLYTYAGGTTTPITTWTDSTGATAHANPIVLDSAGREQGGIWVTEGTAYKVIAKTSADVTLDTNDNVVVGDVAASDSDEYEVVVTYAGTPGAQAWIGGIELKRSVTFPINFTGSGGSVITNPGSTYAIDVQKNGVSVGTVTISTAGVFSFATTGGTTVACVDGDTLDFYGPASVGTAANIKFTLVGDLA
jgi:hypothetical protein